MSRAMSGADGRSGTGILRWVVAGSAVLLLLAILGFLVAGKLRMKNYLANLPRKLGVDIQQETNHFTYSQSSRGRKIFTVRAAKEVQRKDGRIGLHDVGIVLYGPDGSETDRIHGVDFEYDQKAQLLTAVGEVYIDVAPPAKQSGGAGVEQDEQARMIHVKTQGLVFDQKAQVARSDGAVEFSSGSYSGNAVGATYDAQNGVVTLGAAVRLKGLRASTDGAARPEELTASHAVFARPTGVLEMEHVLYTAGTDAGRQSFAGDQAVVHIAHDGTPERVDAAGEIVLAKGARSRVNARQVQLELGPEGQARHVHLQGDVRFASEDSGKKQRGTADEAQIGFDPQGRPAHALLTGGVTIDEQGPVSKQHLSAATLDLTLSGGGRQPTVLRAAEAFGPQGARLQLVEDAGHGPSSTDARADRLIGHFAAQSVRTELTALDGAGHASIERVALGGSRDSSQSVTLHIDFKPGATGRPELSQIQLNGDVATVHEALAAAGAKRTEHTRSDTAVFEAASNALRLSGSVMVQDEVSALFANQVDSNRTTGESVASGNVRVAYTSVAGNMGPAQEPVHVLAERALAHRTTGIAQFFPAKGDRVRMWQGSSQVEAPQIDLYQKEKRLVARGDPGASAPDIRTLLAGKPGDSGKSSGPLRVLSRSLVYSDSAQSIDFGGGVRVLDQDGTLTAQQATVWLSAGGGGAGQVRSESGFPAGKVDHIVATGAVSIDQPGRKATGNKLVYTAADGLFLLTGTPAAPPRVIDLEQGTATGAGLKFHAGDSSIEILGTLNESKAGRVRTETRMSH